MTASPKVDTNHVPIEFFDLERLCRASRHEARMGRRGSAAASDASLSHPLSVRVDDLSLLKHLIPKNKYAAWMDTGYKAIFLLTFALRHQLCRLALLAHANVLEATQSPYRDKEFGAMDQVLACATEQELGALRHLVSADFWVEGGDCPDLYPVIGSSALGCHILFARAGTCRAFDAYAGTQCTAPTDSLYCDEHACDAWWRPRIDGDPSAFAKMSLFYSVLHNASSYDECDIEKMVGEFWVKYATAQAPIAPAEADVDRAADYFGIAGRDGLRQAGLEGLKRRFFRSALRIHPDVGGSGDTFIELKQHYEILHDWLSADGG